MSPDSTPHPVPRARSRRLAVASVLLGIVALSATIAVTLHREARSQRTDAILAAAEPAPHIAALQPDPNAPPAPSAAARTGSVAVAPTVAPANGATSDDSVDGAADPTGTTGNLGIPIPDAVSGLAALAKAAPALTAGAGQGGASGAGISGLANANPNPSGGAAAAPAQSAGGGAAEAAGETCGSTTCPPGKVCCNASCGTCAEPGQKCDQLACGMPVFPSAAPCGANTCNVGEVCCNPSCGICAAPGQRCDTRECMSPLEYPTSYACGMATCNTGMVCCNPSCGLCAPPGEACSHELCAP